MPCMLCLFLWVRIFVHQLYVYKDVIHMYTERHWKVLQQSMVWWTHSYIALCLGISFSLLTYSVDDFKISNAMWNMYSIYAFHQLNLFIFYGLLCIKCAIKFLFFIFWRKYYFYILSNWGLNFYSLKWK